jgi:hypothetical protein
MLRADILTTFMCRLYWNLGASTSWNPQGLSRSVIEFFKKGAYSKHSHLTERFCSFSKLLKALLERFRDNALQYCRFSLLKPAPLRKWEHLTFISQQQVQTILVHWKTWVTHLQLKCQPAVFKLWRTVCLNWYLHLHCILLNVRSIRRTSMAF